MSRAALRIYLNDHLAGATLGCDHARQLEKRYEGHPLGASMARTADEIVEDRDTLQALVERLDVGRNPAKEAGAWVAEKVGRAKFSVAGEDELGTFQALETMALGVAGKLALLHALEAVEDAWPEVATLDLAGLIGRAEQQRAALEAERVRLAARVLVPG
ncbi:MAG: hypothetical protein H0V81_02135 [Solirubrobacterales bacterium]|nr:hypothetical protein [Solirubrobacterales bacterium]